MSSQKSSPGIRSLGPQPIQDILLVDLFCRRRNGYRFEATSLPGHLVQLVIRGRVRLECNGRHYTLTPGCLIWYHEDELVRGQVIESPWEFYSVNFTAPSLPPPAFEERVLDGHLHLAPHFLVS